MPFVMFALWMVTLILMVADWKTEKTRWVAFISFCGGFGALAETIKDIIRPYMIERGTLTLTIEQLLQSIFNVSYVMNHIVGAYAMLLSTVVYCGFFAKETTRLLKVVLFLPPVITVLVSPIFPVVHINWILLAVWAVPYIFVGTYLLFRSYSLEQSPKAKNDKLIVLAAVGGPTMTVAFTNYLARCFGFDNLYNSNIVVIGLLFIFVLTLIFKNNFMGIRIKLEKDRMDSAMKAAVSGTSILNHTIKNEMMKISASADMCREMGLAKEQKVFMDYISTSSDYLLEMTKKIQHHLQEVDIHPEEVRLSDMIHRIIRLNEVTCSQRGIRLEASISNEAIICAVDAIHVSEVLNNLIRNAMEAISGNGKIVLGLFEGKKMVSITVADDGPGISSADLPYVMDPFYTTKRLTMNFGLGLTHSYNIMKKHRGNLELSSLEGNGTIVKLSFPKGSGIKRSA